jgi:thioredoxin-related protein
MKKIITITAFCVVGLAGVYACLPKQEAKPAAVAGTEPVAKELVATAGVAISWKTDYAEAVKQATKEKKTLLLNFTGSDWCGWCIRLDKEVFSKAEFVEYAASNLVCVKLDFPRNKKLPEAEVKQNEELAGKYNVEGFPTILLLNSTEKLLLTTGYQAGGPEAYIKHLKEAIQ